MDRSGRPFGKARDGSSLMPSGHRAPALRALPSPASLGAACRCDDGCPALLGACRACAHALRSLQLVTPNEAAWKALKARHELEAEIAAARQCGVSQAQLEAIATRYPRARRFAAALRASTT